MRTRQAALLGGPADGRVMVLPDDASPYVLVPIDKGLPLGLYDPGDTPFTLSTFDVARYHRELIAGLPTATKWDFYTYDGMNR